MCHKATKVESCPDHSDEIIKNFKAKSFSVRKTDLTRLIKLADGFAPRRAPGSLGRNSSAMFTDMF
jgi:hypothetical protein